MARPDWEKPGGLYVGKCQDADTGARSVRCTIEVEDGPVPKGALAWMPYALDSKGRLRPARG